MLFVVENKVSNSSHVLIFNESFYRSNKRNKICINFDRSRH